MIVDSLEVIDVDHQAGNGLLHALGASELFPQTGVEVTPVVKPCQEVGESATHQAGPIDRVLDADRGHDTQVSQEIGRQLTRKPKRIGAREDQNSVELFVPQQWNDRQAADVTHSGHQQLVVRDVKRPEPRALEHGELRSHRGQNIDEPDLTEPFEQSAVAGQEMADLVLRVLQDEVDGVELVGVLQPIDHALEQLGQRAGA